MPILAYAVVLTLCSGPSVSNECSDYYIATNDSKTLGLAELVHESDMFAIAWTSEDSNKAIAHYLSRYNIVVDTKALVDYDYTLQAIHEDDTP